MPAAPLSPAQAEGEEPKAKRAPRKARKDAEPKAEAAAE